MRAQRDLLTNISPSTSPWRVTRRIEQPAGNAGFTNLCSDPSQAASEVIARVGGGAAVTAARVGVGGHQLGGDGGGGAAHRSKEEYSDAKPELHERPPILSASRDSLSADAINHERFPNGAMWLFSRGAEASWRRVREHDIRAGLVPGCRLRSAHHGSVRFFGWVSAGRRLRRQCSNRLIALITPMAR
jgi:hypothetical protein